MTGPVPEDRLLRGAMSDYYDLGCYSRPVRTGSAEAQLWFDRGLLWCYGFNHENNKRASHHPVNVWSLHGYLECLHRLGRHAEAAAAQSRLDQALARADVKIGASCFCRVGNGCCGPSARGSVRAYRG